MRNPVGKQVSKTPWSRSPGLPRSKEPNSLTRMPSLITEPHPSLVHRNWSSWSKWISWGNGEGAVSGSVRGQQSREAPSAHLDCNQKLVSRTVSFTDIFGWRSPQCCRNYLLRGLEGCKPGGCSSALTVCFLEETPANTATCPHHGPISLFQCTI